jgi:hypothetical protein
MARLPFVTTGTMPRIAGIQALAFHDAKGRIRHMHHAILLEGGRAPDFETMKREAIAHAAAFGADVRKLRVLHVREPFNVDAMHRVDVKRGRLVELKRGPEVRSAGPEL